MTQVTIEVNAKSYIVGCEDGQEARLRTLASLVDNQVKQVSGDVGPLGETRLILMGALLMADELTEARARIAVASGELENLRGEIARVEARAANAIHTAAARIESMAGANPSSPPAADG
ncbi:MAG: cell division protein ZapA [Caulobacteraceae bacterium]